MGLGGEFDELKKTEGGFLNEGSPKLNHPEKVGFSWIFHYKPAILGIPHLWKPPYPLKMIGLLDCGVHFLQQTAYF
jgi:hypothetical protein